MYGENSNECKISVIELEDGYQVEISGRNIKNVIKPEKLKMCIESCCSGGSPSKDNCCC